ncbi:MAG: hypothetical protein CVV33_06530 [Methanomicrobiales archaeon HGW-Methanomicrobiales-4]|nr:MAG: hypothetical protein CVV33_06530 [Methanomicrobiales archaeon HGW-Methanomicrobiales-4]
MDGMAFLIEVRKTSSVPFIMFTGRGNEMIAMEATNNGADYYITKGADPRALFTELAYKLRLSISDRRSETEEQRTKKTIRTLIDKTYDAVIIHTPEGRITEVNDQMLEMFHLTREEALKCSITDLTGPGAPIEKRSDIISRVLAGEDQFLLWEGRRPHDGSIFHIEQFLTRINFGQNMYILCNIRDISKRERDYEREGISHFIINHVSEGIICTDSEGYIRFINKTWEERLGLKESVSLNQKISDIDPALNAEVLKELISKCDNNEEIIRMSIHHNASGEEIPVEMKVFYFSNQITSYICFYFREKR